MSAIPRSIRIWLILLAGLGWIWFSRVPAEAIANAEVVSPQKGFLAPDFTLETLSGSQVTLSALRGQPVILNFWASWCPPCRAEMPALERVHQDYATQGIIVLAVNALSQDDENQARIFVGARGLQMTIPLDADGHVSRLYRVSALPTTFFIDAMGRIQEVVVGGPISEALLRVRAEQLLATIPEATP